VRGDELASGFRRGSGDFSESRTATSIFIGQSGSRTDAARRRASDRRHRSKQRLGGSKDSEETLNFCALTGIRPMIEEFPLEEAARAYQRMITNQVRFRAVVVTR
jgi:D-arabinose 1-dehydrogenase-like Zn-dependent alcohol dehydrogenase